MKEISSALADSLCGSVFAAAGMWLPPSARWVNTGFIYGGLEIYRNNQLWSSIRKVAVNTAGCTHSWIVHSGIHSGICPLFSRLQSSSSPEHTQGEGQVLTVAAEAHWSPQNSDRTTAKPAKLRGCVEEPIFSSRYPDEEIQRARGFTLHKLCQKKSQRCCL